MFQLNYEKKKTSLNVSNIKGKTSRLYTLINQMLTNRSEKLSLRNIYCKYDNYLYSRFSLLNTDDFQTNEYSPRYCRYAQSFEINMNCVRTGYLLRFQGWNQIFKRKQSPNNSRFLLLRLLGPTTIILCSIVLFVQMFNSEGEREKNHCD